MDKTSQQFDAIINICQEIFEKKLKDYGTAWHILRVSSLTDQIFIKAQRIRNIQLCGVQKIKDDVRSEFIGILNYSIIALIQLEWESSEKKISNRQAIVHYKNYFQKAKVLMKNKNHDYGEAWRHIRLSSLTDMILMKLQRVRQIEDNKGTTLISEGIDANYYDIINYAAFALIKIDFNKRTD